MLSNLWNSLISPHFSQIYQIPGFFHGHLSLLKNVVFYQCHLWSVMPRDGGGIIIVLNFK